MTILEKPQTITKQTDIIQRLANNEPMRPIARDHNISISTVHEVKKKNREKIELIKNNLIQNNIDNIIKSLETDIKTNQKISQQYHDNIADITVEKSQFKNIVQRNIITPLLQKVGIFPERSSGVSIQNIHQDNRKQSVIVPEYRQYLDLVQNHTQVIDVNADTENSANSGNCG